MATSPAPKKTTPAATAARKSNTGAMERILLRNDFYRDNFRVLAPSNLALAIALMVSLGMNVFLAQRKLEPAYFSVDAVGRITPLIALSETYVTEPFLVNWTAEQVARAYSMDPVNYRRQVGELEGVFTTEGYDQYKSSLMESGVIDLMTKNLLVSSAVVQGVPLIVDKGLVYGSTYFWKLEVPVLVQYSSATKSSPDERRIVTITVVRRSTLENPLGIGINQFVARSAR